MAVLEMNHLRQTGVCFLMKQAVKTVAELMELAARTAPKAAGMDFIVLKVISEEEEIRALAAEMVKYRDEVGKKNFDRDGRNVAASGAVLLAGLRHARTTGLNCGACGYSTCAELVGAREGPEFSGPWCAWRLVDLGIALGSAAKTASLLNVDNRIMYRIGVVARRMGLIDADVVVGIPLAATGKNIYFDR